jgi:hypothetical protein
MTSHSRRPPTGRRVAAVLALATGSATLVGVVVTAVDDPLAGIVVLAGLALAIWLVWHGAVRRGALRAVRPAVAPSSSPRCIDAADRVFVVTPMLPSRLEWFASDVDRSRHQADGRLDTILGQLRDSNVAAGGAVGDETPLTAIADHIQAFDPDHLLVALRSAEHAGWQERGLTELIQQTFHLPMTVFEIDADGHALDRTRP